MAADSIRSLLAESIEQITNFDATSDGCDDAEVSAFNTFKRGVMQASSGRLVPSELLDGLEPKDVVLRFLFRLHERRRIYRKQIATVLSILLETTWLMILQLNKTLRDAMPNDLKILLQDYPEHPEHIRDASRYVGTIGLPSDNSAADAVALDMLRKAAALLENIDYSVENVDEASDAFDKLRRAVDRLVESASDEAQTVLENMEPKVLILEFLVDLYSRQCRLRSRVGSLLLRLLGFDAWKAEVELDSSVRAAVRELTDDLSSPKNLRVVNAGMAVNLGAAAIAAAGRGNVGALYVRVIGAYNLAWEHLGRRPDPYVRITLNNRMKRTNTLCNTAEPRWESPAYLFEVPDKVSTIKFEIFDSELMKEVLLGTVSVIAAKCSREPKFSLHDLHQVDRGELELELVYMPGFESFSHSGAPDSWLVSREGEASLRSGSMVPSSSLGLRCPKYHQINTQLPGLRWWQGWIGYRNHRRCDVCESRFLRRECRWRCGNSCYFDVCDNCHARYSAAQMKLRDGSYGVCSSGAQTDQWLVSRLGEPSLLHASQVGDCDDSKELRCPAGHVIDKKKVGLHWHQGWTGYRNHACCDLCKVDFTRDEARWRCAEGCHFDVCNRCWIVYTRNFNTKEADSSIFVTGVLEYVATGVDEAPQLCEK